MKQFVILKEEKKKLLYQNGYLMKEKLWQSKSYNQIEYTKNTVLI